MNNNDTTSEMRLQAAAELAERTGQPTGIDPELALSAAASTAITVLGLAALSIFCSTVLGTSRGAMAAAYSALFGYLAFSAVAGVLARTVAARFQGPLISVGGWSLDNSDYAGVLRK